jgi:O-acetyl-ADP-ribose deacetylase (regulator of RNase III)
MLPGQLRADQSRIAAAHASMLKMAHRDHDTLVATVDLPQVADSIYGFHAQQAVEKALKACATIPAPPLGEQQGLISDTVEIEHFV